MESTFAKIFISIFFLLSFLIVQGQGVTPRSTKPLSKWDRKFREIRVGDKIYQTGSNWVTAGIGPGYSTTLQENQINMAIAYHFRYKPIYFKAGYHYTDKTFFLNKRLENISFQNDAIAAIGIRYERNHFNFAFFIGPSLAFGSIERPNNSKIGDAYYALGVVPEVQLTYKVFYDIGLGTSLYGSFNKQHQCVGLRIHLYFSGAYRGVY